MDRLQVRFTGKNEELKQDLQELAERYGLNETVDNFHNMSLTTDLLFTRGKQNATRK